MQPSPEPSGQRFPGRIGYRESGEGVEASGEKPRKAVTFHSRGRMGTGYDGARMSKLVLFSRQRQGCCMGKENINKKGVKPIQI